MPAQPPASQLTAHKWRLGTRVDTLNRLIRDGPSPSPFPALSSAVYRIFSTSLGSQIDPPGNRHSGQEPGLQKEENSGVYLAYPWWALPASPNLEESMRFYGHSFLDELAFPRQASFAKLTADGRPPAPSTKVGLGGRIRVLLAAR
ncbi:hypothetical protein LA080_006765 [Diaporthe eres]|nr:hypothetical protein LA080_006765 [Diaporthe eres]